MGLFDRLRERAARKARAETARSRANSDRSLYYPIGGGGFQTIGNINAYGLVYVNSKMSPDILAETLSAFQVHFIDEDSNIDPIDRQIAEAEAAEKAEKAREQAIQEQFDRLDAGEAIDMAAMEALDKPINDLPGTNIQHGVVPPIPHRDGYFVVVTNPVDSLLNTYDRPIRNMGKLLEEGTNAMTGEPQLQVTNFIKMAVDKHLEKIARG